MSHFDVVLPVVKVSDEELIYELKRISNMTGKKEVSFNDIEQYSKYSYSTYRNHFGTMKQALEKAGLRRTRNWGTTKEEYFNNIIEVWQRLGRQPNLIDMNSDYSTSSASAYGHFFGSWTNALIAFQEWANNNGDLEEIELKKGETNEIDFERNHTTTRFPNYKLRFCVLQRDKFKCCACGASPAKDPSVELHVDHIVPWSKGGETTIDNLQTLCSKCNLGKSDLL